MIIKTYCKFSKHSTRNVKQNPQKKYVEKPKKPVETKFKLAFSIL